MTLTVCVGSSGSGKTTFLNDVHKQHKCIYIRQYHSMRPYIKVSAIPNFDETQLPFWSTYVKEETDKKIPVGGTMAGKFTAGLSGGQRKLLLFELIYQRTLEQEGVLIVLDEPFCGVTDDFVPFIVSRLKVMKNNHNVLLVTNDHVKVLTDMADNVITVSAVDRSHVMVNKMDSVGRTMAINAMSGGKHFLHKTNEEDLKFFFDVEVKGSEDVMGVVWFTLFCAGLFLLTFWDSEPGNGTEALILVAQQIIAYFCINPYLLSLVDWRNYMKEESEALVHNSSQLNLQLKTTICFVLMIGITLIGYGLVNAVVPGFEDVKFLYTMFLDTSSMILPMICLALFSNMALQEVEIFGSLPFLLMLFLSTSFSPGAGVEGVKELRYLFVRYYFWCIVPDVQDDMEGCPDQSVDIWVYMFLSGIMFLVLFVFVKTIIDLKKKSNRKKKLEIATDMNDTEEYRVLKRELFGDIVDTVHDP